MLNYSELTIDEHQFRPAVDWFFQLLTPQFVKMVSGKTDSIKHENYWKKYISSFRRWSKKGGDLFNNERLLEFGMMIRWMQYFEKDWNINEKVRKNFLKRLKSNDSAEGLMYELKTAVHFVSRGFSTKLLLEQSNSKMADIEVFYGSSDNEKILVECTIRKDFNKIVVWNERTIRDFVFSLEDKLESSYDFGYPRIISIKIPENVDWREPEIKDGILDEVSRLHALDRLRSVNVMLFMGKSVIRNTATTRRGQQV